MGENDVRIHCVCVRMELLVDEGNLFFLLWIQEYLLVTLAAIPIALAFTPGGCAVAIVGPLLVA
jgi:hypothetical protein